MRGASRIRMAMETPEVLQVPPLDPSLVDLAEAGLAGGAQRIEEAEAS